MRSVIESAKRDANEILRGMIISSSEKSDIFEKTKGQKDNSLW